LKTLGKFIKKEDLIKLNELIDKEIWFIESPSNKIDLISKIHTAEYFKIPFSWKNEYGDNESKIFEFHSEWFEEEETLIDYSNLKIKITEKEILKDDFLLNSSIQISQKCPNSRIRFANFIISEILILSREEVLDDKMELMHDEGILLIDKKENKILLSAERICFDQVEFINDLKTIEKRIKELKIRKTLDNTV
jgi:hypothetical protein